MQLRRVRYSAMVKNFSTEVINISAYIIVLCLIWPTSHPPYWLAADDIIRQHKTACLRITSLLTCKDFLWVGTSAGVILTLLMPKVSMATEKSSVTQPTVNGKSLSNHRYVYFFLRQQHFVQVKIQHQWSLAREPPSQKTRALYY